MGRCPTPRNRLDLVGQAKIFLADHKHRIALHDLVGTESRNATEMLRQITVQGSRWSEQEFSARVERYETVVRTLTELQILLSYWGSLANKNTVVFPAKRLASGLNPEGGLVIWSGLRWYPVLILLYAAGIAAVAANNYENLALTFHAMGPDPDDAGSRLPLVQAANSGIRGEASSVFRHLPGLEKKYTPLSEHLFDHLRPMFDELLFLGADYEPAFDQFEVLMALECAEQSSRRQAGMPVGAIGRFGWKFRSGGASSPFHDLISEAKEKGPNWPPIRAGLFQGSSDRFQEVAPQFEDVLKRRAWS